MSQLLNQSTAFTFRIGPFLDSSDGATAETGLTIAQADIQISKAGATFAQTSDAAPTTTHDTDGWYQCPLTATDTATLGTLTVQIAVSGALPVWKDFMVVPSELFSLYDSTSKPATEGADSDTLETLSDQLDLVQTQTDKISTSAVNVIDRTGGGTMLSLIRGDTYPSSESAGLVFTLADGEIWPTDLSSTWVFAMTFRENTDNVIVDGTDTVSFIDGTSMTVTVDTATGTSRQITISDFTQSVMQNLSTGDSVYDFDIEASKSDDRMTLRSGSVTITKDQVQES